MEIQQNLCSIQRELTMSLLESHFGKDINEEKLKWKNQRETTERGKECEYINVHYEKGKNWVNNVIFNQI